MGASRFGLLLGLALWVGLAAALVAQLPLIERRGAGAGELGAALVRRVETLLFVAMVLVVVGLGARVVLDRAAPPTGLLVPVAGMAVSRLLAALAVSPTVRALRSRLRDANAPATDAERSASKRLEGARRLLLTLEVSLALYALYAIA